MTLPLSCPVCASTNLREFFELSQVPIHNNLLWENRGEAIHAPRGDICLAFCQDCEHVFNSRFDPARMQYTRQYENALDFSPRFQDYIQSLSDRLVSRYDLYGKDILEIGSGNGDFLRLLCRRGENRGTGFDPASPESAPDPACLVQLIREPYSEKHARTPADLVLTRQTLEHIQQPLPFLSMLRSRREGAIFFIEVPNLRFILNGLSIWDIIYEHPAYYSRRSLETLFRLCGFNVLEVNETFGGQFLTIEAQPEQPPGLPSQGQASLPQESERVLSGDVDAFLKNFRQKMAAWQAALEQVRNLGQKAVVWGTGSKGVSFLNLLKPGEAIRYAVDINPRKHGKYVAGTGQEIVPPDFLEAYQPDLLIVMNPLYEGEIREHARRLGLQPEFLIA